MHQQQGAFASFSDISGQSSASAITPRSSNWRRGSRGRGRRRNHGFVRTGGSSLDTKSKTAAVRDAEHVKRSQPKQDVNGKIHDDAVKSTPLSGRLLRDERKHKWGPISESDLLICKICNMMGHTSETHKCAICYKLGHDAVAHLCVKCNELGHTTDDHVTACTFCQSKQHIALEHECENCQAKGHDCNDHCPVATCDEMHEMSDHECGFCGRQGHDMSAEYHCGICESVQHKRDKHVCTICHGLGHETASDPDKIKYCLVTLAGIIKDQAQTIANLRHRVAKHTKHIRFLRSKTTTHCKRCSGTGLYKTGRGYDSDPEEEVCECKKNGDPGSDSDDTSLDDDASGTTMSATAARAFNSGLGGQGAKDSDRDRE